MANEPVKPGSILDTIKQRFNQLLGKSAIPPLTYRCEPECFNDGTAMRFTYSKVVDKDEPCPTPGCGGVLKRVD